MNFSRSKIFWPVSLALVVLLLGSAALLVKAKHSNEGPPAYRFTVGQDLTYSVSYDNTARADFSGLLPADKSGGAPRPAPSNLLQTIQSSVNGNWVVVVVAQNKLGYVLACHLENAHVSLQAAGQNASDQAEVVRSDLERPVFALINPQGKVLNVRFADGTQSISQNFARALLGSSQFVVSTSPKTGDASWDTSEEDTLGRYVAHYEKGTAPANSKPQHGDGPLFRKTKLRYLPVGQSTTGEAPMAQTIKPDTSIVAHFDAGSGYLTSLHDSEKQTVLLAGQTVAHSQTNASFKFESQSSLAAKDLQEYQTQNAQSEKLAQPVALFVAPDADEVREASRKSTLGQETLGTLLSELAKHQKAGETQSSEMYLKFRALADLHPESCPFLGKLLEVVPSSSLSFRVLSGALTAVDSPQAQDAILFAIQSRPNDKNALLQLIPSVGLAKNPSPATQKVLSELSSSSPDPAIASTAQLALGGMAHSLAKSAPARSAQIVDAILGQLAKTKSPAETQQLLLTIGNTGSPRALPALQRYSRSDTLALRATAVNSLRFIATPDAESLLLTALSQDTHPEVRLAAVQALSFRPMTDTAFQSQKAVLQSDQDASVRLALLNNLYTARKDSPDFREIIEQLAIHDPSPDVRRAATNIKNQNPAIFGEQNSPPAGTT